MGRTVCGEINAYTIPVSIRFHVQDVYYGPHYDASKGTHAESKSTITIISNVISFEFPSMNICPRAIDGSC